MNSTPQTVSSRRSAGGARSRPVSAAWALAAAVLAGAASGCAQSAEFVHPEYARFDVRRIGVYNVENSTAFELRSVSFGGMFQRAVLGTPQYDVHSLLRGAIEESLLLKDYETMSLGSPPAPAPVDARPRDDSPPADVAAGPQDAELYCRILYWKAETGARPAMEMRFRVELYSAAEHELLYAGTFKAAFSMGAHDRTIPSLEKIIRPAVRRAFLDLPPAVLSGEDDA